VEQIREKTILTNIAEISATSIEFSIRVQLAALSDKSDTMKAFKRTHMPVVQTLCHNNVILSSQKQYIWLNNRVLEREKDQRTRLGRSSSAL